MRSAPAGPLRAVLAVALFFAFSTPTTVQAAETLRWKYRVGDRFQQTMKQHIKMTMQLGESTFHTTVQQTINSEWTVERIDQQAAAEIRHDIVRVRMKLEGLEGLAFEFDTDQDQQQRAFGLGAVIAPALRALTKATLRFRMNSRGQILDVQLTDAAKRALAGLPADAQLGGNIMSEEGLINLVKRSVVVLPEEAVDQGSQWTHSFETTTRPLGKMKVVNTLRYQGQSSRQGRVLAKIGVVGRIDMTAGQAAEAGLPKVTLQDQQTEGEIYFDNAAGRLADSTLKQDVRLRLAAQGQTLAQRLEQTTVVTLAALPKL